MQVAFDCCINHDCLHGAPTPSTPAWFRKRYLWMIKNTLIKKRYHTALSGIVPPSGKMSCSLLCTPRPSAKEWYQVWRNYSWSP
uniref:Uncharacterized protein n=1 Tax=Anguilla anguilla TaxID=7936 RepID=A0A0E9SY45_ANGAN